MSPTTSSSPRVLDDGEVHRCEVRDHRWNSILPRWATPLQPLPADMGYCWIGVNSQTSHAPSCRTRSTRQCSSRPEPETIVRSPMCSYQVASTSTQLAATSESSDSRAGCDCERPRSTYTDGPACVSADSSSETTSPSVRLNSASDTSFLRAATQLLVRDPNGSSTPPPIVGSRPCCTSPRNQMTDWLPSADLRCGTMRSRDRRQSPTRHRSRNRSTPSRPPPPDTQDAGALGSCADSAGRRCTRHPGVHPRAPRVAGGSAAMPARSRTNRARRADAVVPPPAPGAGRSRPSGSRRVLRLHPRLG